MAIRRELAAADPDRYRPDLAASLSNLGVTSRSWAARRGAAAARRRWRSTGSWRRRPRPVPARPGRARCPTSASGSSELGRPAEALPVTQEAVAIRRELAAAYPDRYRPDLARSLTNLGVRFSELGRPAEALPADQEAVRDLGRELAAAVPRPVPARPGLLAVQPRRAVLGAGPPG